MEQLLVHDQDLLWETFVPSDVMMVLTLLAVPPEFAKVIRPGVEQKQLVYQVSVTNFFVSDRTCVCLPIQSNSAKSNMYKLYAYE